MTDLLRGRRFLSRIGARGSRRLSGVGTDADGCSWPYFSHNPAASGARNAGKELLSCSLRTRTEVRTVATGEQEAGQRGARVRAMLGSFTHSFSPQSGGLLAGLPNLESVVAHEPCAVSSEECAVRRFSWPHLRPQSGHDLAKSWPQLRPEVGHGLARSWPRVWPGRRGWVLLQDKELAPRVP